jgi:hypothetical protein
MLNGRQLYLVRIKRHIPKEELSEKLGVPYNDVTIYENDVKEIPQDLYEKWISILIEMQA